MKKIPLRHYGELLVTYLKPQWLKVVGLLTLLLGNIGLQLLNPQIVRHFIDVAMGSGRGRDQYAAANGFAIHRA